MKKFKGFRTGYIGSIGKCSSKTKNHGHGFQVSTTNNQAGPLLVDLHGWLIGIGLTGRPVGGVVSVDRRCG